MDKFYIGWKQANKKSEQDEALERFYEVDLESNLSD